MWGSGGNGSVILYRHKRRFREPLAPLGPTPTWGRFNDDLGLREYSVSFSANQPLQYNYRWRDLNGDGNYQPGEVNLDLNGPDYLSVNPGPGFGAVGAGNNIVNPNLKLPHTKEA